MIHEPEQQTPAERLREHGRLLVRRAVTRDDWISDAILDLAAGEKDHWSLEEWETLLSEILGSDMTIDEWLDFHA